MLSPNGVIGEHRPCSIVSRPDPKAAMEKHLCPLGLTLAETTRRYIAATVEACDGNKTEAARRLGVGRNTVTRALAKRRS